MSKRKLKHPWFLLSLTTMSLIASNTAFAHSGPLNKFALTACKEKERSQVCQYEGMHNDLYIGTCQYMPTELMCVRNQPIQKIVKEQTEPQTTHNHD